MDRLQQNRKYSRPTHRRPRRPVGQHPFWQEHQTPPLLRSRRNIRSTTHDFKAIWNCGHAKWQEHKKLLNISFADVMKKMKYLAMVAGVLIACCGALAAFTMFVEWMGYETLPLAQDSEIPAFVEKMDDIQKLRTIEFCWSDLEIRPIAGLPHARVSYLSTNGEELVVKQPITKTERYYADRSNPIYITILGEKQLFEDVVGTAPLQLRVADEKEWNRKDSTNK